MQIKYAVYKWTEGGYYAPFIMPKELIVACNFEYNDRFDVTITPDSIVIKYNHLGGFKLVKSGGNLVLNLPGKKLGDEVLKSLQEHAPKTLPALIQGENLVVDISKIGKKTKGFNLFKAIKKGFTNG